MTYTPQLNDLRHTFADISGFNALVAEGLFPDLDQELVDAVLEEAGKFASEIIAPINQPGDTEGCTYDPETGDVKTASGWKEAYAEQGRACPPPWAWRCRNFGTQQRTPMALARF